MNILLDLTLGILTALGGFIDIGELVFTVQAGSRFGLNLLWAVVVGALAIVVYAEMCGRVAIVTKKPVFTLIREKLGFSAGLSTLIVSNILNILTCAAEIGGVAFVFRLLTDIPYGLAIAAALVTIVVIVWILPFGWIEKLFGFMGLSMLVFLASAIALGPNISELGKNLIPHIPAFSGNQNILSYGYFAIGIIGATVMPYEVYFYSSGVLEDKMKPKELPVNAITAILGLGFGSVVSMALIVIGSNLFMPHGIIPERVGTSVLGAVIPFGEIGLLVALLGLFFAIGGAAVETCFAGAYNLAQFFGWKWGKNERPQEVPRFTLSWLFIFLVALLVLVTGVDPVQLTEYAVIFSVVVLPLTYLPILLVARDKKYMGEHVNTRIDSSLGWLFFVIITIVAILAVPLMYLTHGGQG